MGARVFEVGDMVYLRVKCFQQHSFSNSSASKLSIKYYGHFLVVAKVGKIAYRLQLLDGVQIYPVFHVSLLKKSVGRTDITSTDLPSTDKDLTMDNEPLVVLKKRFIYQNTAHQSFLVQWSYLNPDHTTWEYLLDLLKQFSRVAQLL